MKTSNVIASLFFGSLAAAVPVKRDLYTKTELVVETVVVFTTVWDDGSAPTVATTTAGAFYEQPSKAASSAATTATSAYVASVAQSPSSVYIAPTSTAYPQPQSTTSAYTPPAAPTSQAAAAPASVYTPPSPVSSAPAATSLSASTGSTGSTGSGETHSGGDLTAYYTSGGLGFCSKGEPLDDNAMTVAIAHGLMGPRINDVATGYPMNEMCGKKIAITLNGKTIEATIQDSCDGCENPNSLDLTPAAWYALLGDGYAFTRIKSESHPWDWKVIG